MLYSKFRVFCAAVLILVAATSSRADTIDLAWTPSSDAAVTGYILYVGRQPGAYTETFDVGRASTFTYASAVAGQQYFFAVAAYDATATVGPKSTEISWTLVASSVMRPTLVSPVETNTSATPTFAWNGVQGAASYVLYVDDSVTKAKVRMDVSPAQAGCQTTTACKFTPGVPLATGQAYWAVKAVTSAGSGPWTDLVGFMVATQTLPTLVSPIGTTTSATPTFVWNSGQGAASYVLYVDDSVTKAKVRVDVSPAQAGCQTTTVCKFTPTVVLAAGDAFWAVKAVTAAGTGPWSDLVGFVVAATNTAPVVSIVSPTGGTFPGGTSIAFSGSATDTQDGNLASRLAWTSSIDGALGTGSSFTKVLSAGAHLITASVTDSGGVAASGQVSVNVSAPNTAPVVSITSPTSTTFPAGTSIAFSGSATDTQDGTLSTRLTWTSSIDGPLGTGALIAKVLSAGTHVVMATVVDSGGLTAARQISISVIRVNTAPVVTITSPTTTVFPAGASIAFAGSAADSQDGSLASRLVWTSSIDGQLGTGASFIRPLSTGTHIVTAAAVDSGGLTGSIQMSISVGGANTAPVVTIASPTTKTFPSGTGIAFSGSAADTQDGNLTPRMVWVSSLTGQIGSGGSFTSALAPGTHVVTASVTDGGGATSMKQVTVTVAAPVVEASTQVMLAASAYRIKSAERVDLSWSGLSTSRVDVYRDGAKIETISNTGYWTDLLNRKRGGTYTYTVCGTGTTTCSAPVSATF